jgi:hypothetical protein
VGRPWNDVYAELSQHVNRGNAVQAHVFQHLFDYVAVHTELRDGFVIETVRGLRANYAQRFFYVSPVTHRLLALPVTSRKRHVPRSHDAPLKVVDAWHVARCVDGVWFEIELARTPRGAAVPIRDAVLGPLNTACRTAWKMLARTYGRDGVFGVKKRALGKREIRARGLWAVAAAFETNARTASSQPSNGRQLGIEPRPLVTR